MTPPPSLQELIDTVRQDSPSEDPLDQLATAATAASQLEATTDALVGHFVDRCRRGGRSWSQISLALGVSKQAVHKRFAGPIADRLLEGQQAPTFERFTDRARSVLWATEFAARAHGAAEVGAEHLLVGLYAQPEGLAAKALIAMDIDQAKVEQATGITLVAGSAGGDHLSYSAPAVAVLRDAVVEAIQRAHNYIGTEHLLLALLRDPDTPVAQLLGQLGASPAETRVRVTELLHGFKKP